jgi:PPM family protein phosphatase
MNLQAAAATDIGKARARNEDSHMMSVERGLFAVADGMGGHVAGDIASRTAIEALIAALPESPISTELMIAAVSAANTSVWQAAAEDSAKYGMGTTLTALAFDAKQSQCVIGHVGDSRAYRLRNQRLEQLTHDHTAAQQLIDRGQLNKEDGRGHPLSSMLYRSLGTRPVVDVDVASAEVERGDLYLICSDGLTGMVGDDVLIQLLQSQNDLEAICRDLVAAANANGGTDNITAVLIRAG